MKLVRLVLVVQKPQNALTQNKSFANCGMKKELSPNRE